MNLQIERIRKARYLTGFFYCLTGMLAFVWIEIGASIIFLLNDILCVGQEDEKVLT